MNNHSSNSDHLIKINEDNNLKYESFNNGVISDVPLKISQNDESCIDSNGYYIHPLCLLYITCVSIAMIGFFLSMNIDFL